MPYPPISQPTATPAAQRRVAVGVWLMIVALAARFAYGLPLLFR